MARQEAGHSSPTPSIVRVLARLVLVVGGILAIWLLLPASASAAEDPLGAVDEATAPLEAETEAITEPTQALEDAVHETGTTVDALVPGVGSTVGAAAETLVLGATQVVDGVIGTVERAKSALTITPPQPVTVGDTIGPGLPDVDDPVKPNDPPIIGEKRPGSNGGRQRPIDRAPADVAAPPMHRRGEPVGHTAAATLGRVEISSPDLQAAAAHHASAVGDSVSLSGDGMARGGIRGPVDDFSAFLLVTTLLLCLGRWSRHEAEFRIAPVFLSLAERPG